MFVTIRAKLIGFSLLTLLFVLLVGGAGYYGKTELGKAIENTQGSSALLNANMRVNVAHDEIRADVLQVLREARIGDAAAYQEAVGNFNDHLKALTGNTANIANSAALTEKTRQAIAMVRADVEGYAKSAQDIAVLAQSDAAAAEMQFNEFNEKYRKLKQDQSQLNNLIAEEMAGARQAADEASQGATDTVIIAVGIALAALAICAYLIYRGIMGSLDQLRQAIARVEAGNYEGHVNLNAQDETGALGRAFDKLIDEHMASLKRTAAENERLNNSVIGLFSAMGALAQKDLTVRAPVTDDIIGTLGDAINQLTDVTATVLHHVTKVAGVVEAASERMKKQSDVVNDMAKEEDVIVVRLISNLETAMASIGEVAIFARDSNRAAAEATKSTESAMQTVQATLSGMNAIRETISEMEKRIKRLGERSQEISQIVNLINTISERTHVLSLNAAMQAAMAGEAGRGFAVVAEEVQRLAENSRQATGQIANLVQNIQVETNDTIATVNKTIEQVVNESELAHDAGERMRETHESTARLVRLVATIATSSAEQTKIAAVLRAAADEIAQFTQKTAEQLVAQNQSAASLVSASQKLVGAISVFKLPSSATSAEEPDGGQTQIFDPLKR
ncbi:MAG: methyl-accepting chemotaxis protein [Nitrosomonadales bacterium]|nr:methyl-accepting chemotaxis protein [Nitrosomonadales bacterium]